MIGLTKCITGVTWLNQSQSVAREIATTSASVMKKSTAQPLPPGHPNLVKRLTANCSRYLTTIGGLDVPTTMDIIAAFGKAKSTSVQELVASAQATTHVSAVVIETAALHFSGTHFHPVAVLPSPSPPARILAQGRQTDIRRKWSTGADGLHTHPHHLLLSLSLPPPSSLFLPPRHTVCCPPPPSSTQ